jgi:hypothetical protein
MRDFKYLELVTGRPEWEAFMNNLQSVQSECLKPCAIAFKGNMNRTGLFAMFPAEIAYQVRRDMLFQVNALFWTTGKGDATLEDLIDFEPTPEFVKEFVAQAAAHEAKEKATANKASWFRVKLGVEYVEAMAEEANNEGMQQTLEAILTSIVLESWLFFEAFVSDLWCTAVDSGGRAISARIQANQKWESSKEGMRASQIGNTQADPRTQQGSFKREIGLVSFQKLRSIKDYYKIAFENDIDKLFDETVDGYIYALSDVRNCIAHSAGKVDGSFFNRAKRFPEFANLNIGDKLLLDGDIVRKLRNAAGLTGAALIKAVDEMLIRGD